MSQPFFFLLIIAKKKTCLFIGPDLVGTPAGHALWVKLSDIAFGQYWFQIKQVKFVEGKEFYLRLKCIRYCTFKKLLLTLVGFSLEINNSYQKVKMSPDERHIRIALYCIEGVVIPALMHCNLFKIYCALPNLGITRT